MRGEPLCKVPGRGDGGQPLADVADLPRLAVSPVQQHGQQHGERAQAHQHGDQQVVVGTSHVLRSGGCFGR